MTLKFYPDQPAPPWRVGVFASSADPGMHVVIGAVGTERISELGAHPDFIRWLSADPLAPAAKRVAFYKEAMADPLNHHGLALELAGLSAKSAESVSSQVSELLRIWQSHLGASREQCDEGGRKLWDRIEAVMAGAGRTAKPWCLECQNNVEKACREDGSCPLRGVHATEGQQ